MIKYPLEVPVIVKKLENYIEVNEKLLEYFELVQGERVEIGSGYTLDDKTWMEDSFYKLDWRQSTDFSRPWVQYFLDFFKKELYDIKTSLYYEECHLKDLWFQQYKKGNTHSWHTHGENFTGVYYVELDKDSPKTQIVNPFDNSTVYELDVSEGDLVIFPSFVLHRAPKIQNDIRKTIVSFNMNLLNGMYDIGERISKPTINTKLNRIKNKITGREKRLRKIKLTYDET